MTHTRTTQHQPANTEAAQTDAAKTDAAKTDAAKTSAAASRLTRAGLRHTRQRLSLARLLFQGCERHVTAEQLHGEAKAADLRVSLATVYNTLHQFTQAGLLREVVVEPGRSYFDTNTDEHHHFYFEGDGELRDIPAQEVQLATLPPAPEGTRVDRVDVIVRLRRDTDTESDAADARTDLRANAQGSG